MSEYVVYELVDSMSGSVTNESEGGEVREVNRRYVIGRCSAGFNEVVQQIAAYAPQYVNSDGAGLFWIRRRLNVAGIGNAYFDVTATYQTLQPKPKDEENNNGDFTPGSLAWDTTGHTEHITQGLTDEVRIPEGAADFESAINVSGDSVQGLDVVRPNLRYSETWILPASVAIDCTFIGNVYRLTGTVNNSTFRCFDAGEALFMGARAQWTGDQPYVSVTFDWECRPNTKFYVKALGEFDKEGWEHVWIQYQPESSNGSLIRKPIAAYKNRVYKKESWAGLGVIAVSIGGTPGVAAPQAPNQGGNGIA